jgi:hypothetical protein
VAGLLRGGEPVGPRPEDAPRPGRDPATFDPFAWSPARQDELARRAAAGNAHALYAKSPGGAEATARRVAALRPLVERAARGSGTSADQLEAMVFLESAGRPGAMASTDVRAAAGLAQILASTGRELGLRVDVERSQRLTRQLLAARALGQDARAARLERRRREVDERFDPAKALAAATRYLADARRALGGRQDLAIASYHMGVGNLQSVLRRYGAGDVPYARLFFDATLERHPATYRRLHGFADDSATYLWRVAAAREIMRLHRDDPDELRRRQALHAAKASAEEVLHPRADTPVFASPDALARAYDDRDVVPLPARPQRAFAFRASPAMGRLATTLGRRPALYRGLRPAAFAALAYLATQVRRTSGAPALTVTSTVRDTSYQRALLDAGTPEATAAYSLHTTGWAFDISRAYASRAQALALQAGLDRLQSLDLIAWVREPEAIHVTVGADAERLLPLLRLR